MLTNGDENVMPAGVDEEPLFEVIVNKPAGIKLLTKNKFCDKNILVKADIPVYNGETEDVGEPDEPETTINFYVDGVSYTISKGSNWMDVIKEYPTAFNHNPHSYIRVNKTGVDGDSTVYDEDGPVHITDTVVEEYEYTLGALITITFRIDSANFTVEQGTLWGDMETIYLGEFRTEEDNTIFWIDRDCQVLDDGDYVYADLEIIGDHGYGIASG